MRLAVNAMLVVLATFGNVVAAAEPQMGKDFVVVENPAPVDKSSKIAVIEFFSYQCPHCFAFHKPLHDWSVKLPMDVQFERKAVSIGHAAWVDIARSFYALRSMGKLDALDADIFNAIHKQGMRFDNVGLIMGWLGKRGVGLMEFDAAYRSTAARDAFERGEQLAVQYRVPSIPTLVIDGRYLVAIASNIPFEQQLATVDKLIARARSERAK
jgi:thiol:disulfide interchange protein DsbA